MPSIAHLLKVGSSTTSFLSSEFGSDFHRLSIGVLQTLIGLKTQWVNSAAFWRSCVLPAGALLSFPGENGGFVSRQDPEILTDFWPIMNAMKGFAQDAPKWRSSFGGRIKRILDTRARFANPSDCRNTLRLAGDSTPTTAASINWGGEVNLSGAMRRNC